MKDSCSARYVARVQSTRIELTNWQIRCMECGHRSNKKDPFLDLSLEIPEQFVQTSSRASRHKKVNLVSPSVSAIPCPANLILPQSCDLSECIDGFMRAEELGPESYWCEQCKAKKNATKKFYIARPPKVRLCLNQTRPNSATRSSSWSLSGSAGRQVRGLRWTRRSASP